MSRGYFLDPLVSQVASMLDVLFAPRSADNGAERDVIDDALAAFAYLSAATRTRVMHITDGAIYGCPACLYATKDWSEFEQHRARLNHGRSTCTACGGHDGRHLDRFCVGGFLGPSWAKEDFVVPRAEYMPPSIPQFPCTFCELVFTAGAPLMTHVVRAHPAEMNFRARAILSLPRRHFSWIDRGLEPRMPNETKRRARLLYQCPECFYIFSSWSQWEHHVRVTKHSQPYCVECNKILGRFASEGTGHTLQTGHTRVLGVQPTKETHLRLIDTTITRYHDFIDNPDAQAAYYPGDPMQAVYQCPLAECGAVFTDVQDLDAHADSSGHGVLVCDICHETVRIHDGTIPRHPHAIPNLPCELWFLRDPSESCLVEMRESVLLAYYSEQFARCPECTLVLSKEQLEAHRRTDACVAVRGLRAAAWEHHERVRAMRRVEMPMSMPIPMSILPTSDGRIRLPAGITVIGEDGAPRTQPIAVAPAAMGMPSATPGMPVYKFGNAALFATGAAPSRPHMPLPSSSAPILVGHNSTPPRYMMSGEVPNEHRPSAPLAPGSGSHVYIASPSGSIPVVMDATAYQYHIATAARPEAR
jgi:uncharacterized C2H2 Zn-finger protein